MFARGFPAAPNTEQVYFVTCPYYRSPSLHMEIKAWLERGCVRPLYVNGYIWILSPNFGCELS